MKKLSLLLILITVTAYGQIEKKVCFLGNSYTASNNLPVLIGSLATADGNTLIEDRNTPGGYTLEGHSTNTGSLTKIASNTWDFVVLQEQSQRPSFPWGQVNEEVFPYAEILCDSIRSANDCAIPLFFNTWGRRDGDDQWDSINTFTKMNQRLHIAYDHMANTNSGMLSPVGIGFEHIANDGTAPFELADLYTGDGSHPSIYGSYLAACIFYEIIFETNSEGNTYLPGGLSAENATYIQDVAHHVLTEVDSITIDYTQPEASFTVTYDGLTATFTNTSVHAFDYFWEFGDGETSTEENPVHVYPDEEEYTATLTATYCDKEDVVVGGTEGPSGISTDYLTSFDIYPNPSNGLVNINYVGNEQEIELTVYSLDGQLVLRQKLIQKTSIELDSGAYIVRIGSSMKKLIVH